MLRAKKCAHSHSQSSPGYSVAKKSLSENCNSGHSCISKQHQHHSSHSAAAAQATAYLTAAAGGAAAAAAAAAAIAASSLGGGGGSNGKDPTLSPGGESSHGGSGRGGDPQRPQPVRSPYEWMKRPSFNTKAPAKEGRTRTKDKYRVVYSDHQRLELEKEFHYSRYITIRHAQLSNSLKY